MSNIYYTPQLLIDACFDKIVRPLDGGKWLEPAAGDGRIAQTMRLHAGESALIHAIEIESQADSAIMDMRGASLWSMRNFLDDTAIVDEKLYYDRIITNPPYSRAEEYIKKCLDLRASNGQLVLLLRLAFLESQKRYEELWRHDAYLPSRVWVLPKRPSFDGLGTDSTAYAWFEWTSDKRRNPEIRWLVW